MSTAENQSSNAPEPDFDLEKHFVPAWAKKPSNENQYAHYAGEAGPRDDRRRGRGDRPPPPPPPPPPPAPESGGGPQAKPHLARPLSDPLPLSLPSHLTPPSSLVRQFNELATAMAPSNPHALIRTDKTSIIADAVRLITALRAENGQLRQLTKFMEARLASAERERAEAVMALGLVRQQQQQGGAGGAGAGLLAPGAGPSSSSAAAAAQPPPQQQQHSFPPGPPPPPWMLAAAMGVATPAGLPPAAPPPPPPPPPAAPGGGGGDQWGDGRPRPPAA